MGFDHQISGISLIHEPGSKVSGGIDSFTAFTDYTGRTCSQTFYHTNYWLVVSNIFYFPFHIWNNVDTGLITPPPPPPPLPPPYRSTRSTRSSEEVSKPNPPNNVIIHSTINDYYKIPMGKDWKDNHKPSDSYEKMRQPMVNHQIPMRKDEKTYGKPSDSYEKR